MASRARRIETAKADFVDAALYEEGHDLASIPVSRGALIGGLSRAFDLVEGRRPGHAQRVAYTGVSLARALRMRPARVEDVYFACLLHDAGMAVAHAPQGRGHRHGSGSDDVIIAHTRAGARFARKLGMSDAVARAVAWHHTHPADESGAAASSDRATLVARVVATADRVESLIDTDAPALWVRRRTPGMIRELAGRDFDGEIAEAVASLMERDEFWLGFFDNGMSTDLLGLGFGGDLSWNELTDMAAVMSDLVDQRLGREPGRGREIADIACMLAERAGVGPARLRQVEAAALLQDIGTLGVPVQYLGKPDILNVDEMASVQQHPTLARDIVSEIDGLGTAAWWIGCHHERVDGKGYPGMLEAEDVPLEAQIIGMAEAFVALRSDRPYRPALPTADALIVLQGMASTRFVPELLPVMESVAATLAKRPSTYPYAGAGQ